MASKTPYDFNAHEDIESKKQYEDNNDIPKRRNRWMRIGLATILVIGVLSAAIAIPISLTQKNNSTIDSNLDTHQIKGNTTEIKASSVNAKTGINTDTNANPIPLPGKKPTRNRLVVTANKETDFHPPGYAHELSPYSDLIRLKTFTPPDEGRIFVMGDIHGSIDEMNALLEKIDFKENEDVLILTGDLVFRGKDSVGVISRARELNALCVRGNHDDKVVRFRGYQNMHGAEAMSASHEIMPEGKVGDPLKFRNKHSQIARDMSEEDYKYLAGCPLILDIPALNARVVHGGLDPKIENLIDNDPWSVMNMRDMDDDNEPSKSKQSKKSPSSTHIHWTEAYQRYAEAHNLGVTVYYGHDASRGISLGTKTIGMDSGCVYGRKLSVIDIRTQELTQVDCVKGDKEEEE